MDKITIHGDSLIVINWLNKVWNCHNLLLQALLEEVRSLAEEFERICFKHIYREINVEVDSYSKEGLLLKKGEWVLFENGTTSSDCTF